MKKLKNIPWIHEDQEIFLNDGYVYGESIVDRYNNIADNIEKYCLKMSKTTESVEYCRGISDRFREYIYKGWISFSTPVLTNFGKDENLPISCNKSILSDDLSDIYKGLHELGMLAKYGAGTSQNFSNLRPLGSDISTGGISNSIMDWVELYADMMSKTNQNRARRGYLTAYLSVDHPEINDFLEIGTYKMSADKQRFFQTITTGVTLPIGWLKEMKGGDREKRKIWAKILKARSEVGYPYILDLENTNESRPQVYKDKDMFIETSNICCVSYDTNLLTDNGEITIGDYENKSVNVWNGEEFSNTTVRKTGTNQELYRVTVIQDSRITYLDCTDYHKWYDIDGKEILTKDLEVNTKLLKLGMPNSTRQFDSVVTSIEKLNGLHDVYCFTEPKRGMGVFNGILTGQCETAEYADEFKTFACCLSSVVAYYYDDWKDDKYFIKDCNLMLDCVIEEYIEKASKLKGLEKAVKFAEEHRSIGLGILGFHSFLQKKGLAFGSIMSHAYNDKIFKKLYEEGLESSKWMAENWGEPKMMEGYGLRNSTRLAQAPTKSTAFIMGGVTLNLSEGIEPHKSNYMTKKLAKIQVEVKNIELEKLLETKGQNTRTVWDSILTNNGSVQHLEFLSSDEKDVFKTFSEISQVDVIQLAGERAKYIDQGQSINIMIHPDTPPKVISDLHLMAFDLGVKGLYYQYTINASQMFTSDLVTCSSCEA